VRNIVPSDSVRYPIVLIFLFVKFTIILSRYSLQEIVDAIVAKYHVMPDLECTVDKSGRQSLLGVNLCLDLDLELTSCAHKVYTNMLSLLSFSLSLPFYPLPPLNFNFLTGTIHTTCRINSTVFFPTYTSALLAFSLTPSCILLFSSYYIKLIRNITIR
jgi:hypothetical protein